MSTNLHSKNDSWGNMVEMDLEEIVTEIMNTQVILILAMKNPNLGAGTFTKPALRWIRHFSTSPVLAMQVCP